MTRCATLYGSAWVCSERRGRGKKSVYLSSTGLVDEEDSVQQAFVVAAVGVTIESTHGRNKSVNMQSRKLNAELRGLGGAGGVGRKTPPSLFRSHHIHFSATFFKKTVGGGKTQ